MMSIKDLIDTLLKDFAFLKGKKVAVALSGGADSVCLTELLNNLKNELEIEFLAVHINHNLRGAESNRDEAFCRNFCINRGIPLIVISIDVLSNAKVGESVELAARRLRYKAFEGIDADFIATAHTAEDSIETFLINFVRGTGLKGLCGIPKQRDRFVRPISHFSRADVELFCSLNDLDFVTDSSNLTDDYTRNKIRHSVIPKLKEINPAVISVASRNMELIKNDSDFLDATADAAFCDSFSNQKGIRLSSLNKLHFSIASRVVLKYALITIDRTLEYNRLIEVLDIAKNGSGKLQLYKDVYIEVKNGYLKVITPKNIKFSLKTETISIETYKNRLKINNLLLYNAIDCDKIAGKLVIRNRQSGDKISPVGRGVTKALRKLHNEKGISEDLRDKLPLAADDIGVIWCFKTATDERVKIDENTKNVLVFLVNDN